MYSFHSENSAAGVTPEEIARLLRSIGASGRLVGLRAAGRLSLHRLYRVSHPAKAGRVFLDHQMRVPGHGAAFQGQPILRRARDPYADRLAMESPRSFRAQPRGRDRAGEAAHQQ